MTEKGAEEQVLAMERLRFCRSKNDTDLRWQSGIKKHLRQNETNACTATKHML